MARVGTVMLVAVLCCVQFSEGRSFREFFHQIMEEAEYDKLVLVNTWAPSYCEKVKIEKCEILNTYTKNFTIHGLWPFKSNVKNTPIDCPGTYDTNIINDLKDELNIKWISYKKPKNNEEFWKHEYEKHGTCMNDLEDWNSQYKYFKKTLDLYDKYNIKKILSNNNIRPSKVLKYNIADINTAFNNEINAIPALYCVERKKIKYQYLWEVRMCFNKQIQPITCGDALVGGGKCNLLKKIMIPPFDDYITKPPPPENSPPERALQFLFDVAEMEERERMMEKEEEEEDEEEYEEEEMGRGLGFWENLFNADTTRNATRYVD